ncbi:hypothetical protein KKA85_03430 [bacterium]|nr:hypothetical protein [bacterium]MBU1674815.1 hypothetical protein [bacterium]
MRILLPVIAILLAAAAATAAHEDPQPRPLDGFEAEARFICAYGNQTTATAYEGWWGGDETYARLISPQIEPCECDIGFTIRSVNMMLGLDASADLRVVSRLLEADWNGSCWQPGATLAFSPVHIIDYIALFGYYQISIPCDFPCASLDEPYFITVDFIGGTADRVNIVGGGAAEPCTSYNDWGGGWFDLISDIGFFDELTMWAESECCYEPIGTDASSWGEVKSLYR